MLLKNAIQTPDGTVLVSRHQHDFRTHVDANGNTYMIDGGLLYSRRSCHGDEVCLCVEDDGTLEKAREYLEWGTFGKKEDFVDGLPPQEMKYVLLKDMSNAHIKAILEDAYEGKLPVNSMYVRYFNMELDYREQNKIEILD